MFTLAGRETIDVPAKTGIATRNNKNIVNAKLAKRFIGSGFLKGIMIFYMTHGYFAYNLR